MKRITLVTVVAYVGLALLGRLLEQSGSMTCDCREDCWCQRPGLSVFRWVFPFKHSMGC